MANNATLAGHIVVEDDVILGGLTGVHQFVRIGRMSILGGYTKAVKDVPPYMMADGDPLKVYGLNKIGLDRHGVSAEAQQALKEPTRSCFARSHGRQGLVRIAAEIAPRPEVLISRSSPQERAMNIAMKMRKPWRRGWRGRWRGCGRRLGETCAGRRRPSAPARPSWRRLFAAPEPRRRAARAVHFEQRTSAWDPIGGQITGKKFACGWHHGQVTMVAPAASRRGSLSLFRNTLEATLHGADADQR
jgi:hypothetical protein